MELQSLVTLGCVEEVPGAAPQLGHPSNLDTPAFFCLQASSLQADPLPTPWWKRPSRISVLQMLQVSQHLCPLHRTSSRPSMQRPQDAPSPSCGLRAESSLRQTLWPPGLEAPSQAPSNANFLISHPCPGLSKVTTFTKSSAAHRVLRRSTSMQRVPLMPTMTT